MNKLIARVLGLCMAISSGAALAADMHKTPMSSESSGATADSKGMTKDELKDKKDSSKSTSMSKTAAPKALATDTKGLTKDEMKDKGEMRK